jgi:hypothetical protein
MSEGELLQIEKARKLNLDEAMAILDEFPDSPSKRSLRMLVEYSVEREK